MEENFYFDILYPLQNIVLKKITGLNSPFYLSGGTAASRGYLHHRFSDDLDFFVNDDDNFRLWCERILIALEKDSGLKLRPLLREERFTRLIIENDGTELKIEFINDVPAHVGAIRNHDLLGRIDSSENILANKITALMDRTEPKDLADVWGFCCVMGLNLKAAIQDAHGKAAGIFPPDLARILISANKDDWAAIKWINPPDSNIFTKGLKNLGETLLFEDGEKQVID